MKRGLILTFLLLLLTFGVANSANMITIDTSPAITAGLLSNTSTTFTYDVNYENDVIIMGASNGFVVYADQGVTAVWDAAALTPGSRIDGAWASFNATIDNDSLLTGGLAIPPAFNGVPVGNDVVHTVTFSLSGGDTAEVCIDSVVKIGIAGDWLWDDGTQNVNPGFNNGNGAICETYGTVPCLAPAFVDVPGDVNADHCAGFSFQFTADAVEAGKVITGYSVVSGEGTITNDGLYTLDPNVPGDYDVTVEVANDCPATTTYDFTVTLTNAGLQYNACPTAPKAIPSGKVFSIDLDLDNFDACDAITETVVITPAPTNGATATGGVVSWQTDAADAGQVFTLVVTGEDPYGETAVCTFEVEVTEGATWGVRIAKIGDDDFVFQGHYATLPIFLDAASTDYGLGGFDLLIAYDASALTFINATKGDAIDCWEYFTYRFGPFGNCGGTCPSGLLRIIAMAESNDGPNHPTGCVTDVVDVDPDPLIEDWQAFLTATLPAELASIQFYVTDNRTYECQFVPVYFYWLDCGDNSISDWSGNRLYIGTKVYNINWVDENNPYYELIPNDGTVDSTDHIFGPWDVCGTNPNPDKPTPIRDVDFFNGGVDIACADEIDARGDLNLNNLPNEIADAVLFTNYFIYGPVVFEISLEGQIAASDVNNDGRVLTVGDLVYLVRILTGDAAPFTKLTPFAQDASVVVRGNVVSVNSDAKVGAALFVFDGEAEVTLAAEGMDLLADVVNGETRALVYNIGENYIESGAVLNVTGDAVLTEVELADYNGNLLNSSVVAKVLPTAYALMQNYPNPFNPSTEVAFDLPTAGNWTMDIYNVTGQLVKSFNGYSDAGTVKVHVDANGWASGMYFYRLSVNDFVSTKKMVLMK